MFYVVPRHMQARVCVCVCVCVFVLFWYRLEAQLPPVCFFCVPPRRCSLLSCRCCPPHNARHRQALRNNDPGRRVTTAFKVKGPFDKIYKRQKRNNNNDKHNFTKTLPGRGPIYGAFCGGGAEFEVTSLDQAHPPSIPEIL